MADSSPGAHWLWGFPLPAVFGQRGESLLHRSGPAGGGWAFAGRRGGSPSDGAGAGGLRQALSAAVSLAAQSLCPGSGAGPGSPGRLWGGARGLAGRLRPVHGPKIPLRDGTLFPMAGGCAAAATGGPGPAETGVPGGRGLLPVPTVSFLHPVGRIADLCQGQGDQADGGSAHLRFHGFCGRVGQSPGVSIGRGGKPHPGGGGPAGLFFQGWAIMGESPIRLGSHEGPGLRLVAGAAPQQYAAV